jgi:hypothetical protein
MIRVWATPRLHGIAANRMRSITSSANGTARDMCASVQDNYPPIVTGRLSGVPDLEARTLYDCRFQPGEAKHYSIWEMGYNKRSVVVAFLS